MKILNLYAGIGGNRKLWGDEHDITAIESSVDIAGVYRELYRKDKVFVTDAHEFLINHFKEFDFIWSSPPCPTHGQYRYNVGVKAKGYAPVFPDMKLYEEIIFLQHYYDGLWIVENVKPYYKPLIEPTATLQRHLLWSNFPIAYKKFEAKGLGTKNKISDYAELGFDITESNIKNKRQVLRNCVEPELGLHILSGLIKGDESMSETLICPDCSGQGGDRENGPYCHECDGLGEVPAKKEKKTNSKGGKK